jgi:anaphase-promoting complex subunit 2
VDAGANTSDILTQYISTIKALHELDPSGTTLDAISLPVQLYLRGRQVACYKSTNTEAAAGTKAEIVTQGGVAGHSAVHSDRANG